MKKLIVATLALGSISAFAETQIFEIFNSPW